MAAQATGALGQIKSDAINARDRIKLTSLSPSPGLDCEIPLDRDTHASIGRSFIDIHGTSESSSTGNGVVLVEDVAPKVDNWANFDDFNAKSCPNVRPQSSVHPWKPEDLISVPSPRHLDIPLYDAHILHNNKNSNLAKEIKNDMIRVMKGHSVDLRVLLYGELVFITDQLDRLEWGMRRAAYTFILITQEFVTEDLDRFKANALLCETISNVNKQYTVVPIYVNEIIRGLFSMSALSGICYMTAHGNGIDNSLYYDRLIGLLGRDNPSLVELNNFNRRCLDEERQRWITMAHVRMVTEMKEQVERDRRREVAHQEFKEMKQQLLERKEQIEAGEKKDAARYLLNRNTDRKDAAKYLPDNTESSGDKGDACNYLLNNADMTGEKQDAAEYLLNSNTVKYIESIKHDSPSGVDRTSVQFQQPPIIYATNINIIDKSEVHIGPKVKKQGNHCCNAGGDNTSVTGDSPNAHQEMESSETVPTIEELPETSSYVTAQFDRYCTIDT